MLILQSPARPNAVLEAILNAVSDDTDAFNVAVAYATYQGARTLVDGLGRELGERLSGIPKCAVTCFDFGHTEPDALVYLEDSGFEVRIANLGAGGAIRLIPSPSAFHPKVYIAPTSSATRLIVGSANLSRRALTVNTEVVSALTLEGAGAWQESWSGVVGTAVRLNHELLSAYRDIRPFQRRQPIPDEPPVPPLRPVGELPIFRDEVERGLSAAEFTAFWIEVGYSSGGSGSQLELPRLGHRFFGYSFDQYDDEHHTIGELTLFTQPSEWVRPLTWHGNNRMERVNLPTEIQGGFEYRDRVVLFQRAASRFEVTVADVGSVAATRWRDESAATATLFRVSGGSTRLCGLI